MRESSENRPVAGLSTNRLEAFSDGVFSVANAGGVVLGFMRTEDIIIRLF
jgi:hypothetical protein